MGRFSWYTMPLRLGVCAVAFVALVAMSAAIGNAQQNSPNDCVVAAFYPPFMIDDAPTNSGISIEIMRAAAKRAGRVIDIEFMPFQRALFTLGTGSGCMMPALFRNESREGKFRWIGTYHSAELRFMTIGAPVKTLQEGRTLGSIVVETDASADQFLSGQGFENLIRIPSPASSAQMLQAGRVDAWAQSATAAQRLWQELGLKTQLQIGDPIYTVPIYVTAGLGFPDDLALTYQKAIQSLVDDGTVARILAKYE